MKTLLICLCLSTFNFFHGGHIAEYYYQLEGQELSLKFIIEKEELLSFELPDDCDIRAMTALCTSQYLNKLSFIQINGKRVVMELQNSYTEGDHLVIHLSGRINTNTVEEIKIQNKCFYECDPDFRNRIIVNIAHFQKSYLLNPKRNTIKLSI